MQVEGPATARRAIREPHGRLRRGGKGRKHGAHGDRGLHIAARGAGTAGVPVTSPLHEDRLAAVHAAVTACRASRVLDLGCGDGDFFLRLAGAPGIKRLVGLDVRKVALERLRERLARRDVHGCKVDLRLASLTDPAPDLAGFDCAVLVETIEHVPPDRLSQVERAVFHFLRPRRVVLTTPNAEFNPLLGVPPHRFRHPDHRFEWSRAAFRNWGTRVAGASGYAVRFEDIAGCHPMLGGASQMAVFDHGG